MQGGVLTRPTILIINDDSSLLASRRMLLEKHGVCVLTACGTAEAIREIVFESVDLVLIDATNVGIDHGEMICGLVRTIHPEQKVALLIKKEMGTPEETKADRVILRTGPRRLLVEIDEMLGGRLALDLWRMPQSRVIQGTMG
jgi:CheY-like chemotaxis protein